MSRLWKAERGLRCVFKVLEFFTSIYFVFAMYQVGPHWVMLAASLAVPVYGLYLVIAQSVDPSSNQGLHSVPYLRYKTLVRAKVWQRADIALSLSMSVVCCGFSAILFFGYFKVRSATSYFLHSAISALLLSFLYTFDALITVCQLKSGSVSFAKSERLSQKFPNNSKHTVQADFTSSFASPNDFKTTNGMTFQQHNQQPIQLPKSSSASVPTILDRLRLEIEAEHKYSSNYFQHQQPVQSAPRKSWFDDERHDELTNSTSLSNTSAHQQHIDRNYWEESRQINDLIVAPTKDFQKTTYSRFQQVDEPAELQPGTSRFFSSSANLVNATKHLNLISKLSSLEDELPSPPVMPAQHILKSKSVARPLNQYKISSYPYARKPINPEQIYTQMLQNRSSSNRNSETTGTSEEDLNVRSRLPPSRSRQQHNSTILNYPLDSVELRNENQLNPAPLVFYKTTQAQVHSPVKAQMVLIEDDVESSSLQPIIENVSRGSSKSSATARIDDFEPSSRLTTRPSISSTLVNMNVSH